MKKSRYLTAKQATELLGITAATLYAYVSRGLVRSESVDGDSRSRRYNAEDVEKLKARKEQRKNPTAVAQTALHWGTPILESTLTLITDDSLYYRGHDALKLALNASFEEVAALFWTGNIPDSDGLFTSQRPVEEVLKALQQIERPLSFIQRLQVGLTLASADDLAAYDLRPEKVAQTGARILRLMSAILANRDTADLPIAQALAAAWSREPEPTTRLLNAALILCADHELNVSSFTARVVASADAQPYPVVLAGLAALQGVKHGGSIEHAEALLREAGSPQHVYSTIAERLHRGERIPGFGHPLYPEGDPRCKQILQLLAVSYADHPTVVLANAMIGTVHEVIDLASNVDFALAVLSQTLALPRGAALALFALGRTVGWIGHAIEQYSTGTIIRPRAIYVGPKPE